MHSRLSMVLAELLFVATFAGIGHGYEASEDDIVWDLVRNTGKQTLQELEPGYAPPTPPFRRFLPETITAASTRRRRLGTYSNDYNLTFTHGTKSILLTRFNVTNEAFEHVISQSEIDTIFATLSETIHYQSYGKVTLNVPTVVPTMVTITNGNFYENIDRCRTELAILGYNYSDYDFEVYWKRSTSSVGGSAIPGGRVQIYKYDGSVSTFQKKIVPHEFMHNFGVGHAWAKGQTYGDDFDVLGGAALSLADPRSGHINAGIKHRFGWLTDAEVPTITEKVATATPLTFDLKAHDANTSISSLKTNEYLGLKLDTRYLNGTRCPPGAYDWCPDWGSSNGLNSWYDDEGTPNNIYLYISLRGGNAHTKLGPSFHLVKYAPTGWVVATTYLDVRPLTTSQNDAVLPEGETYVFDGSSKTSIVVKTLSVTNTGARVSVQYTNGESVAATYQMDNAEHFCAHTLSCGQPVRVDLSSATTVVKIGELHHTKTLASACAQDVPGLKTYTYQDFPFAQAIYAAPPEISANGQLNDFCGIGASLPQTLTLNHQGVWWMDGAEFMLTDYKYYLLTPDNPSTSKYVARQTTPLYISNHHSTTTHITLVKCTIWYCKRNSYLNNNGEWFWAISYGPFTGMDYNCYFAPAFENSTDVTKLTLDGLKWLQCKGGFESTEEKNVALKPQPHSTLEIGQHQKGLGWLVSTFAVAQKTSSSSLNLTTHSCSILKCGAGTYGNLAGPGITGDCSPCLDCPSGYESLQGGNGSKSCFWPSKNLRVKQYDAPSGYDNSGDYTYAGMFQGSPFYTTTAHGGRLFRRSGVGKSWKFTGTNNPGSAGSESGYGTDISSPSGCNNVVTIYPQTLAAIPRTASTTCSPDGNHVFFESSAFSPPQKFIKTLISEIGLPPSQSLSSSTSGPGCSCKHYSFAGSSAHCSSPTALKSEVCRWADFSCDNVEPDVTGKNMAAIPINACDGTAAGESCKKVVCDTGFKDGSVSCNGATDSYEVSACFKEEEVLSLGSSPEAFPDAVAVHMINLVVVLFFLH
jgi:hypothetical protein